VTTRVEGYQCTPTRTHWSYVYQKVEFTFPSSPPGPLAYEGGPFFCLVFGEIGWRLSAGNYFLVECEEFHPASTIVHETLNSKARNVKTTPATQAPRY
jgi:hypothetical protein